MGKIVCEPCGATVEGDEFISHTCPKPHNCLSDPRVVELREAAGNALGHWVACLADQERVLDMKDTHQRRKIKRLRTALEKMKEDK